jgi:DNA replication protein DnaC
MDRRLPITLVLELELLDREKRSAERRLKAARFPTIKTLDTFDFAARPSVNKMLIGELVRCEYIDKRENVLLIGNPGTGKSHLATALASIFRAIAAGRLPVSA